MLSKRRGFHNFCKLNNIPLKIELDFILYFEKTFNVLFLDESGFILSKVMDNMAYSDVEEYWLRYVKDRNEKENKNKTGSI